MKKTRYNAYAQNGQGAIEYAGCDTDINQLKATLRKNYGQGWTIIIEKIENDNGIMDFPPEEITRFTILR